MPQKVSEIERNADINDNLRLPLRNGEGGGAHIYENLPSPATPQPLCIPLPELRKYFPREALYENLCRGCGYGVFAAQGHYCHFCQCIVSGGVLPSTHLTPPSPSEGNIYENICEICRGIYSDEGECHCQAEMSTPTDTPEPKTKSPTPTTTGVKSKSRTLLNYSKSSAATLTRFFGSLKQLNRSGSLQRKIFQREPRTGPGSLEIIHNVGEVFRTQETFDMQRICELKSQLQSSQSDQHIYGRVREPDREALAAAVAQEKEQRKKPRVSRIRLLHAEEDQASLFLNESICHWMATLRHQVHNYEDGEGVCQQPKSVPPSYDREKERERELETEKVTLRRVGEKQNELSKAQPEQQLVDDFKRKLKLKREPPPLTITIVPQQREQEADSPGWEEIKDQRRCGINEHLNVDFVNEFLSGLEEEPAQESHICQLREPLPLEVLMIPPLNGRISLWQLMQSAALAASLNVCVRGFMCFYDKSLRMLRERHQESQFINIECWLRAQRRRCESAAPALAAPPAPRQSLSLLPTKPPSDDVSAAMVARPPPPLATNNGNRPSDPQESEASANASVSESAQRSESVRDNKNNSTNAEAVDGDVDSDGNGIGDSTVMAAPKPCGNAEQRINSNNNSSSSDNESSSGSSGSKEHGIASKQQQQQQLITQNCVIKVRRPAPKVPVRNPNTALSNPQKESNNNNQVDEEDRRHSDASYGEEESIYQPIWQFKTLEPPVEDLETEEDITAVAAVAGAAPELGEGDDNEEDEDDDEEDDDDDDDDEDNEEEEEEELEVEDDFDDDADTDADADVMAIQAAAVFAAGVRYKLSTSTLTKRSKMMLPTPLPSPTASMDQGAWETDVEFMFSRDSKEVVAPEVNAHVEEEEEEEDPEYQLEMEDTLETLSLGSTVTNSTATMGSMSSTGSASRMRPLSSQQKVPLVHPLLRNICIFYSIREPKKYSAIFYDYQLSQVHQRFMTRIRRPAPPPPPPALAQPLSVPKAPKMQQQYQYQQQQQQQPPQMMPLPPAVAAPPSLPLPTINDDSGCSCDAAEDGEVVHSQSKFVAIPTPLKEDWALACLAAAAVTKRGVGPRSARKLRVRSNARLLVTDSVLAWRANLQDVNCCEDEEDMIVPVTDILRAQQIQEDSEVQQTQQTVILQRFKSASIGDLVDLPGEDDKKSIKNRMRMKFAVNSNVFRINRSPKSEKKSRTRRGQVNSLYLDEQSKYPLFGAPLNALELNMTDHPNVPRFVVDVCAYIERPDCVEQDGLYRASGNKVLVDELKKKLTHLYDPRFLHTDDIHTLTSLHKQFFRELSAPLITQEAYERLGRSLSDDAAIERMRLAFDEMPEPNRSTLRFLIKHLTRVAAASASNRMPSTNLAIVWGPCLLSANQIQLDIGRMNMLAKVLIENHDRIFQPDNERLVC
ncbi:uncharacterized protein LOC117588297 isoform X1 [Drosophila guanche]|uniref:Blast:Rho GTPase-activating protein 15 n=1 Tax=Drosophila guanche TaxID=7266 RepID=A0A3B0KJH1_DROGU|nr:uncharacterized protein LOC117588297 isoform X1 [Drosophila guanche]SPP86629.1 blast:Rho GTPase-activating protein 15 [Drosophila guanche]